MYKPGCEFLATVNGKSVAVGHLTEQLKEHPFVAALGGTDDKIGWRASWNYSVGALTDQTKPYYENGAAAWREAGRLTMYDNPTVDSEIARTAPPEATAVLEWFHVDAFVVAHDYLRNRDHVVYRVQLTVPHRWERDGSGSLQPVGRSETTLDSAGPVDEKPDILAARLPR